MWLLGVWAFLVFGMFAMGYGVEEGPRIPTWARMTSSIVLVAFAVWRMKNLVSAFEKSLLKQLAIGMAFCTLGDFFMAGLLAPAALGLYGGLGSFATGYVFYLTALVRWLRSEGVKPDLLSISSFTAWAGFTVAGWHAIVYRGVTPSALFLWAALFYALLLAAVAALASTASLRNNGFFLAALGAALLLISDLVLAARMFNLLWFSLVPRYLQHDIVWLVYGTGQAAFLVGFLGDKKGHPPAPVPA